jgi:hypothetical protein
MWHSGAKRQKHLLLWLYLNLRFDSSCEARVGVRKIFTFFRRSAAICPATCAATCAANGTKMLRTLKAGVLEIFFVNLETSVPLRCSYEMKFRTTKHSR